MGRITRQDGVTRLSRADGAVVESETRVAKVNGKDVSAAALRGVSVMDRRGGTTNLGEQIGDKGVLVLLRHLG